MPGDIDQDELSRRDIVKLGTVGIATAFLTGSSQPVAADIQTRDDDIRAASVLTGAAADRPAPNSSFFDDKSQFTYLYHEDDGDTTHLITENDDAWQTLLTDSQWADTDSDLLLELAKFNGIEINSLRMNAGHGLFGLPDQHVNWESGKTNEEAARYQLQGTEKLEVYRLGTSLKGGGTNSNFTLEIRDVDAATTLASVTGGELKTGEPLGTSGAGNTIIVRFTTGSSSVDATPTCINSIVKA